MPNTLARAERYEHNAPAAARWTGRARRYFGAANPLVSLRAYELGRSIILPNTQAGLILHRKGVTLACNNAVCDVLETRPEGLRGEIASTRSRSTPESAETMAKWLTSPEPAQYEIQLKTGAACLIQSRASTFNGLHCRLAKLSRLKRWI